ncbi:MAG: DUF4339 domain-containing protein [Tannerella sp.]|jgi:hypothetical protein|nr:DUF4339 domain-containing protein [Tannerella sp.]
MENKEYFYLSGETRVGPFSLDAFLNAPISRNTLVWHSALPNWTEAWTLPELAELFASQPPPPPPPPPPPTPYQGTVHAGNTQPPWQSTSTVFVNPPPVRETNGVGTAGFVLALVGLFLGWIPVLGWLSWLIGLILSFVGIFKEPKGLAIAGLVISCLGLIVLLLIAVFLGGMVSFLSTDFMNL